jgi:hypothetical protein
MIVRKDTKNCLWKKQLDTFIIILVECFQFRTTQSEVVLFSAIRNSSLLIFRRKRLFSQHFLFSFSRSTPANLQLQFTYAVRQLDKSATSRNMNSIPI